MREFTKSMMSYTWAMSLFGVQQMMSLFSPGDKTAEAFNNVTASAAEELDPSLRSAFQAGDRMQKEMVNVMLGGMTMGGWDPGRWFKMGFDALRRSANCAGSTARGCADRPAPGSPSTPPPQGKPGPSPAAQASRDTAPSGAQTPGWGPMAR